MMWKLDKPSEETKQEYVAMVLPGLAERVARGVGDGPNHAELADQAKDILMPNWRNADNKQWDIRHLKELLINEPASLETKEQELMNLLNGMDDVASRPDKNLLKTIFNYEGVFNDTTKLLCLQSLTSMSDY